MQAGEGESVGGEMGVLGRPTGAAEAGEELRKRRGLEQRRLKLQSNQQNPCVCWGWGRVCTRGRCRGTYTRGTHTYTGPLPREAARLAGHHTPMSRRHVMS